MNFSNIVDFSENSGIMKTKTGLRTAIYMSINMKLHELYTADFDITNVYAVKQKWTKGALFTIKRPRRCNGIIFLNGCIGKYTCANGVSFLAGKRSLVFLPKESLYSVLNVDCDLGGTDAYLIEFDIISNGQNVILSDNPFLLNESSEFNVVSIVEDTVELYEESLRCPSAVKSKIYELIAVLSAERFDTTSDRYASIRHGIKMIESNVYGNDPIERIATECNVSETHFRRLFKEYAQKSPIQYRIELKIEYAKRMLYESDLSVDQIAETLNFESTSYFCRLFKKKTGMTPSEYRMRSN